MALLACGGPDGAPVPGPALAVDALRHDLGAVPQGGRLRHVFHLRNRGGRPLRLASLRTAPDCAATAEPGEVLAPGMSGRIELVCDTVGRIGAQRRTVTIHSNDASRPSVTLAVTADVVADIAPLQPEFYFGRARAGERVARDIRLRLDRPDAVPRRAYSESGLFHASLERRSDEEWRVVLVVAPHAPAGVVRDQIVVETASTRQPRLFIPVLGYVAGAPR
jgi:hypothetical protein